MICCEPLLIHNAWKAHAMQYNLTWLDLAWRREFHEPGFQYLSAQLFRGFVVSADLRDTCWPFHMEKRQSPRSFRNDCAEKHQNPGSQNSLMAWRDATRHASGEARSLNNVISHYLVYDYCLINIKSYDCVVIIVIIIINIRGEALKQRGITREALKLWIIYNISIRYTTTYTII